MDQDFSKKIKDKKKKKIATGIILVVLVVAIIASTKIEGVNKAIKKFTGQNKVTIEIRCDELSEDMSLLEKPEIKEYIPKDGIILKETEYNIDEDTTAQDILDMACKENDIHIEYTYTPVFDSYYVNGINYLYGLDAGPNSGWSYMVDGKMPDYVASELVLKGGEKIVWFFTVDYTKTTMKTS